MSKRKPQPAHGGKRAGAGRPQMHPEGGTSMLTARVPASLIVSLDKRANKWDVSRSVALVRVLREGLG